MSIESNQQKTKTVPATGKGSGRGGRRAGAGRKPGSATKKTREIAERAASEGITPLEYMLQIMRTEPEPGLDARDLITACTLRFEAAKAAAPYIHPRLAAIEHSGGIDTTPQLNVILNR